MNKDELKELIMSKITDEDIERVMVSNDPDTDIEIPLELNGLLLEVSGVHEGTALVYVISNDTGEFIDTYRGDMTAEAFTDAMIKSFENTPIVGYDTSTTVGDVEGIYVDIIYILREVSEKQNKFVPFIHDTLVKYISDDIYMLKIHNDVHAVPCGALSHIPGELNIMRDFLSKVNLLDLLLYAASREYQKIINTYEGR